MVIQYIRLMVSSVSVIHDLGYENGYMGEILHRSDCRFIPRDLLDDVCIFKALSHAFDHGPVGWCEQMVKTDGYASYRYARRVLRDRFESGEPVMMGSIYWGDYLKFLKSIGLEEIADQLEERYEQ